MPPPKMAQTTAGAQPPRAQPWGTGAGSSSSSAGLAAPMSLDAACSGMPFVATDPTKLDWNDPSVIAVEKAITFAYGRKFRDRGPPPPSDGGPERWRGQAWRASGRWGNRGGKRKQEFAAIYASRRKGGQVDRAGEDAKNWHDAKPAKQEGASSLQMGRGDSQEDRGDGKGDFKEGENSSQKDGGNSSKDFEACAVKAEVSRHENAGGSTHGEQACRGDGRGGPACSDAPDA